MQLLAELSVAVQRLLSKAGSVQLPKVRFAGKLVLHKVNINITNGQPPCGWTFKSRMNQVPGVPAGNRRLKMQRFWALVLPFALLPLSLHAQQKATPSVPEILTWISSHFEVPEVSTVVILSGDQVDNVNEKFKTSITFQGCRVSVTQVETDRYTKSDTGEFDYSLEQTGTATLDLSKGLPDEITAGKGAEGQPPAHVIIKFAQPFAWSREQRYSAHPVPQDLLDTFDVKLIEIGFTTKELAVQQARAWHDAIVACGGKPSAN